MRYIVANWKMGPSSREKAETLLSALAREIHPLPRETEMVLCPPFVWLALAQDARRLNGVFRLGAQDVFFEEGGAHTGEISAAMLKSLGVSHVVIGHSERRALGETNDLVAQKLQTTLRAGLSAILCVGETERSEGQDWHRFLRDEIETALSVVESADAKRLIVAYEPVWAVGAAEPDTPDDALTAAIFIRKIARARFGVQFAEAMAVLYGGSVSPDNIRSFAHQDGIDGVLVGRSSLEVEKFSAIIREFAAER